MEDIAVVILNYNGRNYLEQFLPTLLSYSKPSRVIVADNKSTDDSIPYLQKVFPEVELILLDENYGYAGGYNEALKQIESKYFLLINSDIEVTPNWIKPMYDLLEANLNIASVQPKILAYHNKDTFEHAGAAGGFLDWLGYPFCRGRIFEEVEKDEGQYDDPVQIFWATGACFLIRSEIFFNSGMFDSDFFAHMEEIDLCWRINAMGHEIHYEPKSVVYHVGGGTLAASNPWKTELNFRNGLIMLYKNLPFNQWIYKIPIRITLDLVASLKFLTDKKPGHAKAVLKAIFQFMGTIRTTHQKRRNNQPKIGNKQFRHSEKLLIWQHFLKEKKKYSEL